MMRSRSSMRRAVLLAVLVLLGGAGAAHAAQGDITTIAGNGTGGFSGDGGAATSAALYFPGGVAIEADGGILIADAINHRVRRISPSGTISTIAGTGTAGFSGDGGPATSAMLRGPSRVAVEADGSVLISDLENHRVRRVSPAGVISTIAGTGTAGFSGDGGPAASAQLNFPYGLAVTADGSIFIADYANRRVRKISPAGVISTVAGNGASGFSGDGGLATAAQLRFPQGVAFTADGTMYIADSGNNRVRKVSPAGVISTFAGNGSSGSLGDGGPAADARIHGPTAVAVAPDGTVLISDNNGHRIRRVDPATGVISTVVGVPTGTSAFGFAGDGGPATLALMRFPYDVAVTKDGTVVVADTNNHRIRRADLRLVPTATAPGTVTSTVATELSISVAPTVSLGALVPSLIGSSVSTSTAVTVNSTAANAVVQISDPDTSSRRGFLVNTTTGPDGTPETYALANALQVNGPSQVPASLASGPVNVFDATLTPAGAGTYSTTRSVTFTQALGANEGLRSGTYGKTLTFSVSTTTP